MLKLNASYSKKVPADTEYSSQSCHASIEVEIPDGLTAEQLQNRIHETFDLVRNSVETELHGSNCTDVQLLSVRACLPCGTVTEGTTGQGHDTCRYEGSV